MPRSSEDGEKPLHMIKIQNKYPATARTEKPITLCKIQNDFRIFTS